MSQCHTVNQKIQICCRPAAEFFGIAGKKHETASEAGEQIIRFCRWMDMVWYSQSTSHHPIKRHEIKTATNWRSNNNHHHHGIVSESRQVAVAVTRHHFFYALCSKRSAISICRSGNTIVGICKKKRICRMVRRASKLTTSPNQGNNRSLSMGIRGCRCPSGTNNDTR